MKKKAVWVFVVVVPLAIAAWACGSNGDAPAKPAGPSATPRPTPTCTPLTTAQIERQKSQLTELQWKDYAA